MGYKRVSLYFSDELTDKIDRRRGLIKRSPYLSYILNGVFDDEIILLALEPRK